MKMTYFEDIVTPNEHICLPEQQLGCNVQSEPHHSWGPKEKLEEAEAGRNYERVMQMTDISLPCDGDVIALPSNLR